MATGLLSKKISIVHIRPTRGMRSLDLAELWQYRDLLYFLVWRNIKIRYVQSVFGIGWSVIHPAAFMLVFTVFFGSLLKVGSDGAPYAVFSYVAMAPWAYFSNALTTSTSSLIQNANMVTKIYFPRVLLPASAIIGRLVDLGIALILAIGLMAWFRITPTIWALALPLLIFMMVITASGLGMWLAALAVQYRDIPIAMTFGVQLLLYAAPVVYPASIIPEQYRLLYGLNPMVGVIEGFRSALLGTNPMPWDLLAVGSITAVVVAMGGVLYFRRMERIFADVV